MPRTITVEQLEQELAHYKALLAAMRTVLTPQSARAAYERDQNATVDFAIPQPWADKQRSDMNYQPRGVVWAYSKDTDSPGRYGQPVNLSYWQVQIAHDVLYSHPDNLPSCIK